jgi:hypothetical protein
MAMPKKRWISDGPRNSQGFGWEWRFLQSILRMSAEHKQNWDEVNDLRDFFDAHADLIPTQNELLSIPAEKLIDRVREIKARFVSEQTRRKAALEKAP